MVKTENFEKVEVKSAEQLHDWLLTNHEQEESIWLVTYKKVHPDKYLSVSEVLDELIAFGWIDGVRRKLDADRTMQLVGPRRAQHWAKTYKERAKRLEEEGRMQPAGRKAIEASKENGLWTFMDDVDALIKPADFLEALQNHQPAEEVFNNFGAATQRFILRWIKLAKKPETRKKRILEAASLAAKGEKIPGS